MNGKGVDQLAFNEAQPDLEDGQIAALFSVDQVTTALMNGTGAGGNRPDIQENDGQGQTGQALRVVQHGAFQIEAVTFEIAKHQWSDHK